MLGNSSFQSCMGKGLANNYNSTIMCNDSKVGFIGWYAKKHIKNYGNHLNTLTQALTSRLTLADACSRSMKMTKSYCGSSFDSMWIPAVNKMIQNNQLNVFYILDNLVDARYDEPSDGDD